MSTPFNPYMPNMQPKSPQQIQAEISAMLQNQYAPMYNAYQQQGMNMSMLSQNSNQLSTNGMYVFVNDYNDVENYPVPADGRAVLLYINGQNVYYSKKIVNGQPMLQAYNYMPINMNGSIDNNSPTAEEKPQTFEDKVLSALQELSDRITTLETAKPKQSKSAKKDTVEVSADEL